MRSVLPLFFAWIVPWSRLRCYLLLVAEKGQRPGPEGRIILLSFRGLKPPAPCEISDLEPRSRLRPKGLHSLRSRGGCQLRRRRRPERGGEW